MKSEAALFVDGSLVEGEGEKDKRGKKFISWEMRSEIQEGRRGWG